MRGPHPGSAHVNYWGTFWHQCIVGNISTQKKKEHPQVQEVLVFIFKKVWLPAPFIISFPCSMSAVKHLKIKVRLHSRKAKPNKIFCRKYDNLNFFFQNILKQTTTCQEICDVLAHLRLLSVNVSARLITLHELLLSTM